jgi:hypothetical protein
MGLVIAVVAAGLVAWRMTATERREPPGAPATAVAAVAAVFTDLPAELRPPARVTDLPTDRGVGRAALIYHANLSDGFDEETRAFARRDIHLVTTTGDHFRVGRTPADLRPLSLSLSPDGRWLGAKRDGRWRVRDLSGTTEYEAGDGYELWLWSTDARSVLLGRPSADGRELAVFDPDPMVGPSAPSAQGLSITLHHVATDATRRLPVIVAGQTRPGETIGPIVTQWHVGGNPPRIWTAVERPDPRPTRSRTPADRRRAAATLSAALLGVDATSGAATARIELAGGSELCRGVVADGVVLQQWTRNTTELIVVDPTRLTRRVVTTLPGSPELLLPGARV